MFTYITLYGLAVIVAMSTAYAVARYKRRDASAWAFLSFFFPPAAILLIFLPRSAAPKQRRPGWDERDQAEDTREFGQPT